MPRHEVQATGPNAIRNRPPAQAGEDALANDHCATPALGIRTLVLPPRNLPTLLAHVCGVLALLLTVGSYLAVRGTPWVTPLYHLWPPGAGIGGMLGASLGVLACGLGLVGVLHHLAYPAARGLLWVVSPFAAGGLAVLTAWATFVEAMSYGC
jgi:hypothetical protein